MIQVSPATFKEVDVTISPKDRTATSVVPPPISRIMLPEGFEISRPAPIAATFWLLLQYKPSLLLPDKVASRMAILDHDIIKYVKDNYKLLIGDRTAEAVKMEAKYCVA